MTQSYCKHAYVGMAGFSSAGPNWKHFCGAPRWCVQNNLGVASSHNDRSQ